MQSVTVYGRLIARALFSGVNTKPRTEPLHLVTGSSGFSKSFRPTKPQGLSKLTFGDDAYFIARNKVADVIGKENEF